MKLTCSKWSLVLAAAVLCLALGVGGAAAADAVYVDVVINGEYLERAALVHGDRTFVNLRHVARVLNGRYIYDHDLRIGFVLTGNYLGLVADQLAFRNPPVDGYHPISRFMPGIGIHYGVPAPHLTLAFIPSGIVTAFNVIMTDPDVKHEPWFDQPTAQVEPFLIGDGYSQHLWVIDRTLLIPDQAPKVAFNGKALNISRDSLHWQGEELFVQLRDLAAASGGGVGWDAENRVATARIVPGEELTWSNLGSLNMRTIRYYEQISPFVPSVGYRFGTDGPGLVIGLDGQERVATVSALFPAQSTPWFPWFDQPYGDAPEFPGYGRAYSQHIYLMQREAIEY